MPLRRHARLVEEDPPEVVAVGEHLGLQRQERAARVDEVHARQPVLLGDLLRAQVLLDREREVRAALHRRVVRDDHALASLDDADPGDDPRARRFAVVDVPRGERVQLEERRARIDEQVDALAREQLAARAMPLDGALAAAGGDLRGARAELLDERLHPGHRPDTNFGMLLSCNATACCCSPAPPASRSSSWWSSSFVAGNGGGSSRRRPPTTTASAGGTEAQTIFKGVPQQNDYVGSASAPATLTVYEDPQCPFCRQWDIDTLPTVMQDYVRTGKVRLRYRGIADHRREQHRRPAGDLRGRASRTSSGTCPTRCTSDRARRTAAGSRSR